MLLYLPCQEHHRLLEPSEKWNPSPAGNSIFLRFVFFSQCGMESLKKKLRTKKLEMKKHFIWDWLEITQHPFKLLQCLMEVAVQISHAPTIDQTTWPDYVFHDKPQFLPLDEFLWCILGDVVQLGIVSVWGTQTTIPLRGCSCSIRFPD